MNTEGQFRKEQEPPVPESAPAPGGIGDTVAAHLAGCVARLEDPELKPGWVVHEVRKDLKRVRALLRLSADALPTRRLEKRCAAVGRELSHLRDAVALGETLARLRSRAAPRQLAALEAVIDAHGLEHAAAGSVLPRAIATESAGTLRKVLRDCQAQPFERMDAAAIDAGLAESWAGTARAFRSVVSRPALPRFHELRKAVKRELHQRELSGRPTERMERATLKKLADVLGELQDLDVLRERLREAGRWRGPVRKLVRQTIRELKARALRIGVGRYATGKS